MQPQAVVFVLLLLASIAVAQNPSQPPANQAASTRSTGQAVITNQDIISLLGFGLSPETVKSKVQNPKRPYGTSPAGLEQVTVAAGPDSVILAMVQSTVPAPASPSGLEDIRQAKSAYLVNQGSDLKVFGHLPEKLRKWGRWTLVYHPEDADLLLVLAGAGTSIPLMSHSEILTALDRASGRQLMTVSCEHCTGAGYTAGVLVNQMRKQIEHEGSETPPVANEVTPKNQLQITEGSASEISNLSGSYAGEVANATLGLSAPFNLTMREENGGIYGCTTVQKPLVGSGGFQGTVNGSKVVFEATGKRLRIRFIGELQGDALKGSYTVLSTHEHGEFQLRRKNSTAPPVGFDPAQCRRD